MHCRCINLIHTSTEDLAKRVVSSEKTLYAYFPLGPSSLPVLVAHLDVRLANKTPEKCFTWLNKLKIYTWFIRTNICSLAIAIV